MRGWNVGAALPAPLRAIRTGVGLAHPYASRVSPVTRPRRLTGSGLRRPFASGRQETGTGGGPVRTWRKTHMQSVTRIGNPTTIGFNGILERAMRFELTTPTMARLCSTPELRPHKRLSETMLRQGRLQQQFAIRLRCFSFWPAGDCSLQAAIQGLRCNSGTHGSARPGRNGGRLEMPPEEFGPAHS